MTNITCIFAIVLDIMAIIPYVGFLFALGSLGLWIPILIGYVKDIIHSAKGTMTDGQGLPVTKW